MSSEVIIKPYSLKELAAMYQVSKNTLKRWMTPFQDQVGQRHGYYYNNNQVQIIFEKLGKPNVEKKLKPKP